MNLLLHVCCANCYLHFLEHIKKEKSATLFFYNPNIHPRSEWLARLEALKKVSQSYNFPLKIMNYSPKEYFQQFQGLTQNRQKLIANPQTRCPFCWRLRLEKTARYAQKNNFTHISTTLLTSQHQNQSIIKRMGQKIANRHNLRFFAPAGLQACHNQNFCGFYKQNYCGCAYSLQEKYQEKYF